MKPRHPSDWSLVLRAGAWLGCLVLLAVAASTRAGVHLRTRIVVSSRGLDFFGPTLHKAIPRSHLRVAEARIVDLDREPSLRPALKIYGVGLPWYHLGWFRLRDGQKSLVAVARSRLVVYVPSVRGPSVLIGADDPVGLLAALRQSTDSGQVFLVENAH